MRCEKILKDSNRKIVWEKRFGFPQSKSKSKPMTFFFSGTHVSKRDQILCHILRSAICDLLLFTFRRHLNRPLGCDFFAPIHRYANTQKAVFLLFKGYLPSQPSFVYLFCKKGDFFAPIHRYTLQNGHFLFVYSFFFLARMEFQTFVSFGDTNKYTDAKKDAK